VGIDTAELCFVKHVLMMILLGRQSRGRCRGGVRCGRESGVATSCPIKFQVRDPVHEIDENSAATITACRTTRIGNSLQYIVLK
jgi:hypothetical protein